MPGGFGIENANNTWFYENQNVALKCLVSVYDFHVNVTWFRNDERLTDSGKFSL